MPFDKSKLHLAALPGLKRRMITSDMCLVVGGCILPTVVTLEQRKSSNVSSIWCSLRGSIRLSTVRYVWYILYQLYLTPQHTNEPKFNLKTCNIKIQMSSIQDQVSSERIHDHLFQLLHFSCLCLSDDMHPTFEGGRRAAADASRRK